MANHLSTMKKSVIRTACALFLYAATFLTATSAARADVILHAFNWKYSEITARATEISAIGYRKVLIAPPLKAQGGLWWALYQPQDYRVVDHALGNLRDLKQMIAALGAEGIEVYADVVLSHMANEAGWRSDLNYPGAIVLADYAQRASYFNANRLFGELDRNLFSAADFYDPFCIKNYANPWEVQHGRICSATNHADPGLPSFVDSPWVIEQQKNYLLALKELGIRGFRIDAAKHMTMEHLRNVLTPEVTEGMTVFGEIITYGGEGTSEYHNFLQPFLAGTNHEAYDFPLLATIVHAFTPSGSLKSLINPAATGNALQGRRAITMTTTHDIANNGGLFQGSQMNEADEWLATVYLLGRDGGKPIIYSDHGESGSHRWAGYYQRENIKKLISFHNQLQGAPMSILSASDCYLLWKRGDKGLLGINKCTIPIDIKVSTTTLPAGSSFESLDLFQGTELRLDNETTVLTLAPRSAAIWSAAQ